MGFLKDEKGQKSMMRLITLLIIIAGLTWGTTEIIAHLILAKYGVNFDIHETLILTIISIGVTGKGAQKAIEQMKNK